MFIGSRINLKGILHGLTATIVVCEKPTYQDSTVSTQLWQIAIVQFKAFCDLIYYGICFIHSIDLRRNYLIIIIHKYALVFLFCSFFYCAHSR